jgi:hypothetical protein
LVAENLRYACCYKDCSYITIDEVKQMYPKLPIHPWWWCVRTSIIQVDPLHLLWLNSCC